METKYVKDIMFPIDEYAVVSEEATLYDSFVALNKSQRNLPEGRQRHRAVVVADKNFKIIGKLGHLGFLKALEPKYGDMGNLEGISKSGVSKAFITSMMDNFGLWQSDMDDIVRRAHKIKIKDVMRPFSEHVDANETLGEAIHKIIIWETISILVTDGDDVVGILRVSDVFDEMSRNVLQKNT